jgi:ATP-dependent RNA helicase DeaD
MNFEDMNIEKSVLGSLNDIGFTNPTRIQSETIPMIKDGQDVIGQSETGSGKTGAFGIPLVEKVKKGGKVQGLILAPTRELAKQIAGELKKFSQFKGLYVQTVYGGVSMGPQISGLRKAEIVVGTPGRILDHMRRGNFDTSNINTFILDEADRMIDMGFIQDIEEIERNIPGDRQTLLFSATMPQDLMDVREKFTKNAKKVRTKIKVNEEILKQHYCDVDRRRKFSLLVHLIKEENPRLSIIFCNTRKEVDEISKNLQHNGINATALHGGLSQHKREKVMESFHKGITKVLVATDVAGRGLDIKNVTHIFNYRIPKNPQDYANRIGRTARAGESGKAISLLSNEDHDSFRRIMNRYSYDVEKMEFGDFKILPFKKFYNTKRRNYSNRRFTSKRRRFDWR